MSIFKPKQKDFFVCTQDYCMLINQDKKLIVSLSILRDIDLGLYQTNAPDVNNIINCKSIVVHSNNFYVLSNNKIVYFLHANNYSDLKEFDRVTDIVSKLFSEIFILTIQTDINNFCRSFNFLTSDGKLYKHFFDKNVLIFDKHSVLDFMMSNTKYLLFDGNRHAIYTLDMDAMDNEVLVLDENSTLKLSVINNNLNVTLDVVHSFLCIDKTEIVILSSFNLIYSDKFQLKFDSFGNKYLTYQNKTMYGKTIRILDDEMEVLNVLYACVSNYFTGGEIRHGFDCFTYPTLKSLSHLSYKRLMLCSTIKILIVWMLDDTLKIFEVENIGFEGKCKLTENNMFCLFGCTLTDIRVYNPNENTYI